jgi:hypothetical protein
MGSAQIREALHEYINHADDRVLNLIYGIPFAAESPASGTPRIRNREENSLRKLLAQQCITKT